MLCNIIILTACCNVQMCHTWITETQGDQRNCPSSLRKSAAEQRLKPDGPFLWKTLNIELTRLAAGMSIPKCNTVFCCRPACDLATLASCWSQAQQFKGCRVFPYRDRQWLVAGQNREPAETEKGTENGSTLSSQRERYRPKILHCYGHGGRVHTLTSLFQHCREGKVIISSWCCWEFCTWDISDKLNTNPLKVFSIEEKRTFFKIKSLKLLFLRTGKPASRNPAFSLQKRGIMPDNKSLFR